MPSELSGMLRHAAQLAQAHPDLEVFAEEPVSLDVFMRDKRFLGGYPLSDIQYDAVRHIERIYYKELYPLMAKEFDGKPGVTTIGPAGAFESKSYWGDPIRLVNFITLEWGKGGGKDHTCRVSSLRVSYLLMCLRNPQGYYGMPEQDTIHLLNVASSSSQAQEAFFNPMKNYVKQGWFDGKCEPHVNTISYEKNISCISGHSDAETQEGMNLLLGVADEIDAFKSKDEIIMRGQGQRAPTKSSEAILEMIETSASTRFPQTFKNVRISYPRFLGSKIQQLVAEAEKDIAEEGDASAHYVSGPKATWEVHPHRRRSDFDRDYKKDPVLARSKFECKPSKAIDPYFRNFLAVEACMEEQDPFPVTFEYARDGNAWAPRYSFAPNFVPIRGARYAMHGDLAIKGDRAGIAMAHVVGYDETTSLTLADGDGAEIEFHEARPRVKVDFVISFEADIASDPPREIQIRWARQLCFDLIKLGFNIRRFTFDGFQCLSGDTEIPLLDGTTKTMQELEGSEPFWVYSIKDGRVVPGLCTKAWKTGLREDMVEVELDNGEVVRATSDHLFMLRDGSYRQAGDLVSGDSLMPLYRRLRKVSASTQEYEQIWHPQVDGARRHWRFTHSMVSHSVYGPVPHGSVTHHKDVNCRNNTPENLIQLTNTEHMRVHSEMSGSRFSDLWKDPEWRRQHTARLSACASSRVMPKGESAYHYRRDVSFGDILRICEALVEEGLILSRAAVEARVGCSQDVLYARVREAGFGSWKQLKWELQPPSPQADYMRAWKKQRVVNHKVVAVRRSSPEWVYDLQVEEHHNFAVSAGVFVHNSKDSMQILESRGIESERVSTDLSEDPWKNLRDLMYESRVKIPRVQLCVDELLTLTKLPNGKVDHLVHSSKDLADATACAVYGAVELGGREDTSATRVYYGGSRMPVGNPLTMPIGMNRYTGLPLGAERYLGG